MSISNLPLSVTSLLEDQYPGLFSVLLNRDIEPIDQDVLQEKITTLATQLSPGLTTNLPATLIENMSTVAMAALTQMDQLRVSAVNSISPLNAPSDLLDEFGEIYGVKRGLGSNPSVYVNFTGTPGLFLAKGFQVTDSQYLFETQENLTIPSNGILKDVYVVATTTGSYIIPPYSVTQVISSIQPDTELEVENSQYGTIGDGPESDVDYRGRILRAGTATCQGTPNFIKTCLQKIDNVIDRSVAVSIVKNEINNPIGYSVQVDGGDPTEIAGAIYQSCFDLINLKKSINTIGGVTNGKPCVITTDLTHGLKTGQKITISNATGTPMINGDFVATVIDASRFSIDIDTTSSPFYSGGGVLETNSRDMSVTIIDGKDKYVIPFIKPLKQNVKIICHWQTSAINIIDNESATQLCSSNIASYINSIESGDPINLLQLGNVFESSILELLPGNLITELYFEIYLDDILTSPNNKSNIINGDSQSYFVTTSDQITLIQT